MITLAYNNATRLADIVRMGGNIQTDETLETAVLMSLFTRRKAEPDDVLPDPLDGNRQGYWADPYATVEGHLMGSRLWLLSRSIASQAVLNLAREYAREALLWLVEDEVAASVDATTEKYLGSNEIMAFRVDITKPEDPAAKWWGIWQAHLALL